MLQQIMYDIYFFKYIWDINYFYYSIHFILKINQYTSKYFITLPVLTF